MNENNYTELSTPDLEDRLEELSKYYTIRRKEELTEFLKKHSQLIPYIKSITPIINDYFPDNQKCLSYYIDPEFEDLNQPIIYVIGNDSLFDEERPLMSKLKNELLYSAQYPTNIKNLISVRLWWI